MSERPPHRQAMSEAERAIREAQEELDRYREIHEEVRRVEQKVAWPHPRRRQEDRQ